MTEENEPKRRFFKDGLDSSQDNTGVEDELQPFQPALTHAQSFLFTERRASNEKAEKSPMITEESDRIPLNDSAANLKRNIEEFSKIVPGISFAKADYLCKMYSNEEDVLSKAIEHYFEDSGSSNAALSPVSPRGSLPKTESCIAPLLAVRSHSPFFHLSDNDDKKPKRFKSASHSRRFIGSLQVNAMATRPTMRPIKYASKLKIAQSTGGQSNSRLLKSARNMQKVSMASYVKVYDEEQDREIGRVPENIARILFPLLNGNEVEFEATMIFCDNKRLSIGDNFIFQLDCFLSICMFDKRSSGIKHATLPHDSKRKWDNSTQSIEETSEEVENEARIASILKLFDKLRIKSVRKDKETGDHDSEDEAEVIDLDDVSSLEAVSPCLSTGINDDTSDEQNVMDMDQIKIFYRATQSIDFLRKLPEVDPPKDIFKLTLRRYQKQGLAWMLRREQEFEKLAKYDDFAKVDNSMVMNPLWHQFKWPKDMSWVTQRTKGDIVKSNSEPYFYANLHTGEFSSNKPILKTMMKGGILSDEMGLGKTISTLALIFSCPSDSNENDKRVFSNVDTYILEHPQQLPYASNTTLIVVPMSLLNQWNSEFEKANNSVDMRSEIYYGGNVSSLKKLLTKTKNPPTVILTTYGIVQNEWSKITKEMDKCQNQMTSSGLFSVEFFRIVIDEGHIIRNRMTGTSKAILQLSSRRRWVLTGTPIINRLDDLYSLVKFLRLEPWSQISHWKMFISEPFEKKQYKKAFDVVNAILEPVSLRRTKQMKGIDGKLLVELPAKEIVIERLPFNEIQDKLYKYFLGKAENSVKSGLAKGDLLKKYSTILVHILRLRQICCDFRLLGSRDENDEDISLSSHLLNEDLKSLTRGSGVQHLDNEDNANGIQMIISKVQKKFQDTKLFENIECSICTTEPIPLKRALFLECGHSFCESCIMDFIQFQKEKNLEMRCPNCREAINTGNLLRLEVKEGKPLKLIPFHISQNSAKLEALIKHLKILQDTAPGEQVVIFSQFSSYLHLLENELSKAFFQGEVRIYRFDGQLSLKERANVLQEFSTKSLDKQKVLLLSLKAGGVGLNLTCASYAFMMDPWWSPSMEDQAIDRIHRIGQINNVKVTRFIMENSIEEKMLKIQERKRTIGQAMDADEGERKKRRIEEIQMLFE